MSTKGLSMLRPNPRNPRRITDKKSKMLTNSLARFGDLGCIVVNRANGGQIVGGHQRLNSFANLGAKDVTITKSYATPSHTGTVAEGFVEIAGERYAYREVEWDEMTEKAANLAANKGAGEWDNEELAQWLHELKEANFRLDLTMFAEDERDKILGLEEPDLDITDHDINERFDILITCRDEAQQALLLERFQDEGITCKPLLA